MSVPVVFLDTLGYFDALFRFVDDSADAGFVSEAHARSVQRADSVDDAIRIATSAPAAFTPKWTR